LNFGHSNADEIFQLYNERLAICYGNVKNRDGAIDQGWKITANMVEELGQDKEATLASKRVQGSTDSD